MQEGGGDGDAGPDGAPEHKEGEGADGEPDAPKEGGDDAAPEKAGDEGAPGALALPIRRL